MAAKKPAVGRKYRRAQGIAVYSNYERIIVRVRTILYMKNWRL